MPVLPIGPTSASAPASAALVGAPTRATFGSVLRAQGGVPAGPSFRQVARAAVADVERARERLDAVLAAARRGRTFTPQELLALQADAYRYSQIVEVASKVVEQGAQSVKQAVNTQV